MGERVASGVGGAGGDLNVALHTSVAMLYNNLVTRPTGRAVRKAIEQRIEAIPGPCLSILDFSQVGVIDFSCADEVIAKLLRKYRGSDRPSEAYFVLQGVSEHHREPIETVLRRHNLLLVAVEGGRATLWGPAPARLRMAWDWLEQLGRTVTDEFASARGLSSGTACSWLKRLVSWRVAVPEGRERLASLTAARDQGTAYERPSSLEIGPYRAAAEGHAGYGEEAGGADRDRRWQLPI